MFLFIFRIIRQGLWLLTLAGLLTGCSTLRLAYEQTPRLGHWWLDGQLDLSEAQSRRVREVLHQLQQWHREQALADALDTLGQWSVLAEGPLQASQVCQAMQTVQNQMDVLARETIRRAGPVLSDPVTRLSARQRAHLQARWQRQNADWQEEWLQGSPEALLARRVDKAIERYADFYGALNTRQKALVRQMAQESVWTPQWGWQERLRRQREVLMALEQIEREALSSAQTETLLLAVWQRMLQPAAPNDRERLQALWQQSCEQLAQFHASTSAEQRLRAARRLRSHERDLRPLLP